MILSPTSEISRQHNDVTNITEIFMKFSRMNIRIIVNDSASFK